MKVGGLRIQHVSSNTLIPAMLLYECRGNSAITQEELESAEDTLDTCYATVFMMKEHWSA